MTSRFRIAAETGPLINAFCQPRPFSVASHSLSLQSSEGPAAYGRVLRSEFCLMRGRNSAQFDTQECSRTDAAHDYGGRDPLRQALDNRKRTNRLKLATPWDNRHARPIG